MATPLNRPTVAQEGGNSESRQGGAVNNHPPHNLLILASLLILAVASGVIVGLQALMNGGHDEPLANSGKSMPPAVEMPWLQSDVEKLVGSPVLPAQREVLPARSITLRVTTSKGNILFWSLTTASGKWERTQDPVELEVRLASGAAEELRPTLEKFVAGGKFTAGEQAALGATFARMNFLGQLEMTRRNP